MKVLVHLPEHTNLLIAANQEVDFSTPLLHKGTLETKQIPISQILGFPPDKIFLNLKKFVGEKVQHGDLIAEHKAFLTTKQYMSEFDGVIKEINYQNGSILLEMASDKTDTLNCFFKGEVVSINENELELKVKTSKEFEIEKTDMAAGGKVSYEDETQKVLNEEKIDDKMICASEIKPFDQVKYETLGADGFILLRQLEKPSVVPAIKIKNEKNFKAIQELKLPYCIVNANSTTITFYE